MRRHKNQYVLETVQHFDLFELVSFCYILLYALARLFIKGYLNLLEKTNAFVGIFCSFATVSFPMQMAEKRQKSWESAKQNWRLDATLLLPFPRPLETDEMDHSKVVTLMQTRVPTLRSI